MFRQIPIWRARIDYIPRYKICKTRQPVEFQCSGRNCATVRSCSMVCGRTNSKLARVANKCSTVTTPTTAARKIFVLFIAIAYSSHVCTFMCITYMVKQTSLIGNRWRFPRFINSSTGPIGIIFYRHSKGRFVRKSGVAAGQLGLIY